MADLLAIISKAVFEEQSKAAKPGDVLPMDRYVSGNKALEPLLSGGRLFLVTVRPPDERLWLVAVLDSPKHDGKAWKAKANTTPVTDISALRSKIRFTSDTGISATKGALGMSLQTPRALTEADVAMLFGSSPPPAKAPPTSAKKQPPPSPPPPAASTGSEAPKDVRRLLEGKRWAEALPVLLEWWAQTRAPELAALIERVETQLPVGEWPLGRKTVTNLTAVLATLTEGKFADSLARILQLERQPPDPRIAAALARFIVTPPFTAQSSREFWGALYEFLGDRHADPRTLDAVAQVAKDYQATFGRTKMGEAMERRLSTLVTTLKQRFATVPTADVRALEALVPKIAAPEPKKPTTSGKTLEDLLAAVYANPDDDGVRQVYADALLEAGDPRGEFMMLQFKRARGETLSPAEARQEAALLKTHVKAWVGPLYDVLQTKQLEFEKGFLFRAHIRPQGKAIAAARNHPAWTTVRELSMSAGGTNERGTSLLLQPNARHLRVLTDVIYLVLDELAASPGEGRLLESLHVSWLPIGGTKENRDEVAQRAWQSLLTGKAFPRLRTLSLGTEATSDPEALSAFWTSPLAGQLERIELAVQAYETKRHFALAVKRTTKTLSVVLDFHTYRCTSKAGGLLELESTPVDHPSQEVFPDIIAGLEPSIWKRVVVSGLGPDQLEALAKQLPRATIEQR